MADVAAVRVVKIHSE